MKQNGYSHSIGRWPEVLSPSLTRLLVDCHMINYLDSCSSEEVAAYQNHQISVLLSHAARNSDWWRIRLGIKKGDRSLSFSQIPLLTRDDLRESIAQAGGPLQTPGTHGEIDVAQTSGSSGIPLTFYYTGLVARLNQAYSWLDRQRRGVDSSKRVARFSVHLEPHEGPHLLSSESKLLHKSAEYQRRSQQFTLAEHAQWIKDIQPNYIIGHPTLLSGIIDELAGDANAPRVDLLITFAETVTSDFRRRAKAVLGASTADRYSSQELGPLAFQCPQNEEYYHVAIGNVRVEVLDENGAPSAPGEIGRIYATGLHTLANPIVRYELGDLASLLPRCVCGHPHATLANLLGRERFLLKMPDGSRRYVNFGARHWLSIAPLDEARIVQYVPSVITAEYVMKRPLTADEHQLFLDLLKREITPDIRFEVVRLPSINWGTSYKRQDVVSFI
jgi:phenylacetate-CoA ligase